MQRNRPRIAEPIGAGEEKCCVAQEKIDRNVGAARRVQHHDGEKARPEPRTKCSCPTGQARSRLRTKIAAGRTMARPAGLNTCLPLIRRRNFEEMAITPPTACIHDSSARNKRLSDSPVIRGERRSTGIFVSREQATWVSRLAARANVLAIIRAPKSITAKLIVKRLASAMIWRWRASDHMDRKRRINTGHVPN